MCVLFDRGQICVGVTVGNIVGHECVQAASRMNNTIVLFLSTIEKANEVEL